MPGTSAANETAAGAPPIVAWTVFFTLGGVAAAAADTSGLPSTTPRPVQYTTSLSPAFTGVVGAIAAPSIGVPAVSCVHNFVATAGSPVASTRNTAGCAPAIATVSGPETAAGLLTSSVYCASGSIS